ncbi:hypothetical protein [Pseudomonas phage PA1C]|nr:hypothetical protein [Pseudomonas phage PA1C]
MNVCCNKLFRSMGRNRRALFVDASLVETLSSEKELPPINWRKAVTIKASEDWVRRKLKLSMKGDENPIIELAEKYEFRKAEFNPDHLKKHYFTTNGDSHAAQ